MPSGAEYYVGVLPGQEFLDTFMKLDTNIGTAPQPDFSRVVCESSVKGMARRFVGAVERCRLCPGLRLFITKTRKPKNNPSSSSVEDPSNLCAPLAIRRQPRIRKGRKKRDLHEYYDFATGVLGIEVIPSDDADPFYDFTDYLQTRSSYGQASPVSSNSQASCQPSTSGASHERLSPPAPSPTPADGHSTKPVANEHGAVESMEIDHEHHCRNEHGPNPPRPLPCVRTRSPGRQNERSPATPSSGSTMDYEFANRSDAGGESRRSLVAHAQAQFARQHLVFLFQVILVNRWVRFVRWDRSGGVITERMDYVSNPTLLAEFLWRFSHMDDEQRGWDATVSKPSRAEGELFRSSVTHFLAKMNGGCARKLPRAERTLDDTKTYPLWKVRVVNEVSGKSTELVVGRPLDAHPSLFKRATRPYLALDLQTSRLVFMKDSWRILDASLLVEFNTYQELYRHEVPHLPNVLYGGDVRDNHGRRHETYTQTYSSRYGTWRVTEAPEIGYVHHRIVQDLAYPLDSAADEREFIQALRDALHAMDAAYVSAGLLHRDVSMQNIMLTPDGRGILNDWDHAGRTAELAPGIGTWTYMSVALLQHPEKLHTSIDDIQSHYWVLVHWALKRFAHLDQSLPLAIFDEERQDSQGNTVGGRQKELAVLYGDLLLVQFPCAALKQLIVALTHRWHTYLSVDAGRYPEARRQPGATEVMEMAPKPSYWLELFDKALQELPEPVAHGDARLHSVEHRAQCDSPAGARNKRKAENIPVCELRRSKRIKNLHS